MNSTSLKLSGVILFSMIPFTFIIAEQPEFEKLAYEQSMNADPLFSFYEVLEYVKKKKDSPVEKIYIA